MVYLLVALLGSGAGQGRSARAAWPVSAVAQLVAVGPASYGKSQECAGTALLLDSEGYLLTNAHVVDRAHRCLEGQSGHGLLVRFANSRAPAANAISCHVVALDEEHDLALLRADTSLRGPRPLRSQFTPSRLPLGTELEAVGFPKNSWKPVIASGPLVGYQEEYLNRDIHRATQIMVVKIALRPGSSGSPVYLADGKLAGIAEARLVHDPDKALVIPVRYVVNFLTIHNVPLTLGASQ